MLYFRALASRYTILGPLSTAAPLTKTCHADIAISFQFAIPFVTLGIPFVMELTVGILQLDVPGKYRPSTSRRTGFYAVYGGVEYPGVF